MKKASGFTLIEVLVTLVLTAVGILGMVAMQSRAIQQTQDAVQRNTAVMLVNELVDIMRVNSSELFTTVPPHSALHMGFKDSSIFFKAAGSNFSTTGGCPDPSAAKTAQQQLNCWVTKVNSSLPLGQNTLRSGAYVCPSSADGVCGTGSTLEIQLAWEVRDDTCLSVDENAPADTQTCFYRTRVEL